MRFALLLIALASLAFSQFTEPAGSPVDRNTFNVSAVYSGNCLLQVNGTSDPDFGAKYFAIPSGGRCTATVTLDNGTYEFRMFGGSLGNQIAFGTYEVVPDIPGGCAACENLGNTTIAYVFPVKNEGQGRFEILLVGENQSDLSRSPLEYAPVLVHLHNESYSRLVKTVTNEDGIAYLDYDPTGCLQYSFMYCCFYEDCGFLECVKAFGIKDDYLEDNGIEDIDDVPLGDGASDYPLSAPKSIFPSIEKVDICADEGYAGLTPALCFPLALLLGLLFASMSYAGKTPFMGFDIGAIRLGRHMKYTPMGVQRGMKISAQMAQGLASQVASRVSAGKRYQKAAAATGEKVSLGKAILKSTVQSEARPFTNMIAMVKGLVTLDFKGAGKALKATATGADAKEMAKTTGEQAKMGLGAGAGRGPVQLGLSSATVVGGSLSSLFKGDFKGALSNVVSGIGQLTGISYFAEAGRGIYYGAKHGSLGNEFKKFNDLRSKFETAKAGNPDLRFDEFLKAKELSASDRAAHAETNRHYEALMAKAEKEKKAFRFTFEDFLNGKKGLSPTALARLNGIDGKTRQLASSSSWRSYLALPIGIVIPGSYDLAVEALTPDNHEKTAKMVKDKAESLENASFKKGKEEIRFGDMKFAAVKRDGTPFKVSDAAGNEHDPTFRELVKAGVTEKNVFLTKGSRDALFEALGTITESGTQEQKKNAVSLGDAFSATASSNTMMAVHPLKAAVTSLGDYHQDRIAKDSKVYEKSYNEIILGAYGSDGTVTTKILNLKESDLAHISESKPDSVAFASHASLEDAKQTLKTLQKEVGEIRNDPSLSNDPHRAAEKIYDVVQKHSTGTYGDALTPSDQITQFHRGEFYGQLLGGTPFLGLDGAVASREAVQDYIKKGEAPAYIPHSGEGYDAQKASQNDANLRLCNAIIQNTESQAGAGTYSADVRELRQTVENHSTLYSMGVAADRYEDVLKGAEAEKLPALPTQLASKPPAAPIWDAISEEERKKRYALISEEDYMGRLYAAGGGVGMAYAAYLNGAAPRDKDEEKMFKAWEVAKEGADKYVKSVDDPDKFDANAMLKATSTSLASPNYRLNLDDKSRDTLAKLAAVDTVVPLPHQTIPATFQLVVRK